MTPKEWAELEPGMVLYYQNFYYRTSTQDHTGQWIVEKLNTFNKATALVTLNVNDKRLKNFKLIKNHIASAEVIRQLELAERRKVQ